jgi:2-polyprenyl-6-methoxyphenol hydroxylase-like FAD-dependent oxidoreductase
MERQVTMAANVPSKDHAVVIGGSIAGLLAARVLSDTFHQVTIVDRDELPTAPTQRKGVPQGRHTHALLARGCEIMEELLPGFRADLIARGAATSDLQRDAIWYNEGHLLRRNPSTMTGLLATRPLIESYLRSRVQELPTVQMLAGTVALGLSEHEGKIDGVLVDGPTGSSTLPARLVVDATGRSSRGPSWLTDLGYPPVPSDTVDAGIVYSTREYRRVPGAQDFGGIVIAYHPGNPVGTGTAAAEGNRWMVTLIGMGKDAPPGEPGAFEDFAVRLDGPELHGLISNAAPLTEPVRIRVGPSVRRRYEHCGRLPEGFVAVGDSLSCFNPAYGQGMTSAAMAARWLGTCLDSGLERITKRYFAGAARIIDVSWNISVGADLRFPTIAGPRTAKVKMLNAYLSHLHRAGATDPVVGEAFLRVANFLCRPERLISPRILWRVWRARTRLA